MEQSRTPVISLIELSKRFGDIHAVREVSLSVGEGEFLTLLGPSGCGKSTTLRMIAGLERPDSGRILLRGSDCTHLPPNHRPVHMVFQDYALFPHLSVFENVAFGLRVQKIPRRQVRAAVPDVLSAVRLQELADRKPSQLSGGQQQRVALARALVNRPVALLLDEPLGALDVKLRRHLQSELKDIQAQFGTTFLYVTHDQEEAMALSDRIAVMNHGVIEQIGAPRDVYQNPATEFVADFIGSLNIFDFTVEAIDQGVAIMNLGDHILTCDLPVGITVGQGFRVALRPEGITLHRPDRDAPAPPASRLMGVVRDTQYLGMTTKLRISVPNLGVITVSCLSESSATEFTHDDRVILSWLPEAPTLLHGVS